MIQCGQYRSDGIYVNGRKIADWPSWERTCPRCSRFHSRYLDLSGDAWRCIECGWEGDTWGMTVLDQHLPDEMGFGYEDGTVWLPKAYYLTRSAARTWFANWSDIPWIEVSVLSRWAIYDPQPHESEWWAECPKDTPGAFPVWRCE